MAERRESTTQGSESAADEAPSGAEQDAPDTADQNAGGERPSFGKRVMKWLGYGLESREATPARTAQEPPAPEAAHGGAPVAPREGRAPRHATPEPEPEPAPP